jgi:ribosome-associated protein
MKIEIHEVTRSARHERRAFRHQACSLAFLVTNDLSPQPPFIQDPRGSRISPPCLAAASSNGSNPRPSGPRGAGGNLSSLDVDGAPTGALADADLSAESLEGVEFDEEDFETVYLAPSTSYHIDSDEESRAFAIAMARMAWEVKAEDILVLHVAPICSWTRFMVFATAFSRPQLNAMLGRVMKEAETRYGRRPAGESIGASTWELLDYGDVVVHVLSPDQRDYYDLEGFYGAAEEVELDFERPAGAGPQWDTKV